MTTIHDHRRARRRRHAGAGPRPSIVGAVTTTAARDAAADMPEGR